jgi:hypothetical protein
LLSSGQLLAFVAAIVVMVLLVPAAVWFASGSRVQAQRALKGYGAMVLVLAGIAALGGIVGVIAAFTT